MEYPLTQCLNPRLVENKYTGQVLEVSCGCCKACALNRSRKMATLCQFEENEHKYAMFFTLTYSDEYLPIAVPEFDNENGVCHFISICDRLDDSGKCVCSQMSVRNRSLRGWYALLSQKVHLSRGIGYCSKRDVQLFLKRVRKHLTKYTDEKIRYYIVSEYGPKTFRPHYHGLFFFDEEKTLKVLRKVIRTCWPYGRIDCSLSRGKCSSYCSSYINSSVSLPSLYSYRSVRPFSLHSRYFAIGVYKAARKKVYENALEQFVRLRRVISGRLVELMPWRSLAHTFFPKCKGYNVKSYGELYRAYTILCDVKRAFRASYSSLSIPQIAKRIVINVSEFLKINKYPVFMSAAMRDVSRYFLNEIGKDSFVNSRFSDDKLESVVNKVCSILYISRHFLFFVCDKQSLDEYHKKIHQIIDYWNTRDYFNLVRWYRLMELFSARYPSEDLSYFYYNKPHEKTRTSLEVYQRFVIKTECDYYSAQKHKVQNDMNNIFINQLKQIANE